MSGNNLPQVQPHAQPVQLDAPSSITILQGETFIFQGMWNGPGHFIFEPQASFITALANFNLLQPNHVNVDDMQVQHLDNGDIAIRNISGDNIEFTINHQ